MRIKINFATAKQTKWHQYLLRFVFGGVVTALTGLVAQKFGPEIGGLFLAFPAIFPASATLIEKHEAKKKERAGLDGVQRGRTAAGLDGAGAALGAIGLGIFALLGWKLVPVWNTTIVLLAATAGWFITSITMWYICKKTKRFHARKG
jgi:hypothetical protein